MPHDKVQEKHQDIVKRYFAYIKDLRSGRAGSVDKLTELWDSDGVFEFAGSPPVVGTFTGRVAIHTLYKNRFHASGMPLKLEGAGEKGAARETALGIVDTEIHKMRLMDEKIVVGWNTVIGTQDGHGYTVAGSHTFAFKDGKISSLKVVVSPRADPAPNMSMEGLSVNDIGRLALAAWPVV